VPGSCVILRVDDILLIAPTVCGLGDVMRTCELELDELDINTRKSGCLRMHRFLE